jgi:hypothetical protein
MVIYIVFKIIYSIYIDNSIIYVSICKNFIILNLLFLLNVFSAMIMAYFSLYLFKVRLMVLG